MPVLVLVYIDTYLGLTSYITIWKVSTILFVLTCIIVWNQSRSIIILLSSLHVSILPSWIHLYPDFYIIRTLISLTFLFGNWSYAFCQSDGFKESYPRILLEFPLIPLLRLLLIGVVSVARLLQLSSFYPFSPNHCHVGQSWFEDRMYTLVSKTSVPTYSHGFHSSMSPRLHWLQFFPSQSEELIASHENYGLSFLWVDR